MASGTVEPAGVRVVHAIPGRIRLKIPMISQDPRLASDIEERLSRIDGVRRVETSPVTGSVLVFFEGGAATSAGCLRALSDGLPALFSSLDWKELQAGLASGGNGAHTMSALDRRIMEFFSSLNSSVSNLTSGIDLRVLVPLALFFLGMRALLFSGNVPFPSWYDYFWFALSTFIMLNGATIEETVREAAL